MPDFVELLPELVPTALRKVRLEPWDALSETRMLFALIGHDPDYEYRMLPVVFSPEAPDGPAWTPLRPRESRIPDLKGLRASLVAGDGPGLFALIDTQDVSGGWIDDFVDVEKLFFLDLNERSYGRAGGELGSRQPLPSVYPLNRSQWFAFGPHVLYWDVDPASGCPRGKIHMPEDDRVGAARLHLPVRVDHANQLESPLLKATRRGDRTLTLDFLDPGGPMTVRRWRFPA